MNDFDTNEDSSNDLPSHSLVSLFHCADILLKPFTLHFTKISFIFRKSQENVGLQKKLSVLAFNFSVRQAIKTFIIFIKGLTNRFTILRIWRDNSISIHQCWFYYMLLNYWKLWRRYFLNSIVPLVAAVPQI